MNVYQSTNATEDQRESESIVEEILRIRHTCQPINRTNYQSMVDVTPIIHKGAYLRLRYNIEPRRVSAQQVAEWVVVGDFAYKIFEIDGYRILARANACALYASTQWSYNYLMDIIYTSLLLHKTGGFSHGNCYRTIPKDN